MGQSNKTQKPYFHTKSKVPYDEPLPNKTPNQNKLFNDFSGASH